MVVRPVGLAVRDYVFRLLCALRWGGRRPPSVRGGCTAAAVTVWVFFSAAGLGGAAASQGFLA